MTEQVSISAQASVDSLISALHRWLIQLIWYSGCQVTSVADADDGRVIARIQDGTNQSCKWKKLFPIAVGDYVDVLYDPRTMQFEIFKPGGATVWSDAICNVDQDSVRVEYTNSSTGTLNFGEVVVYDSGADLAVDTTTTAGDLAVAGVVVIGGAVGGLVELAQLGIAHVLVNGNVTRGQFLRSSTTRGQAEPVSTTLYPGVFGIALTANTIGAGGTVRAFLVGHTWDTADFDVLATFVAGITFDGASAANVITMPDNVAQALNVVDAGGLEFVRIDSTNVSPRFIIDPAGTGILYIGIGTPTPADIVDVVISKNAALSIAVTNLNAGNQAVARFIATSDAGDARFAAYSAGHASAAFAGRSGLLGSNADALIFANTFNNAGDIRLMTRVGGVNITRLLVANNGAITLAGPSMTVPDGWILGIGPALERIVFDAAGDIAVMGAKFGVGTLGPTDLIHAYNPAGTAAVVRITAENDRTDSGAILRALNDAGSQNEFLVYGTTAAGAARFGLARAGNAFFSTNAPAFGIGTAGAANVVIGTDNTMAITIDTSQNVGIGTTTPKYTLDTRGTVASWKAGGGTFYGGETGLPIANANLFVLYGMGVVAAADVAGGGMIVRASENWGGAASGTEIHFYKTTNGVFNVRSLAMIISNAGRIGIGTIVPSRILDCNDGSGNMIADGYDNHPSWLANKVDPKPLGDVLTKFKQLVPYQYKRIPYVSAEELAKAAIKEFGEGRWELAFPDGYRGGKLEECPDPEVKEFLGQLGDKLREERQGLPEWQRLHYGLAMDDLVDTFPDILSRDPDGGIGGYSLNNYVGLLHGCIAELLERVERLE